MPETWGDRASRYLRGTESCPRCERRPVIDGQCRSCGAVLTGPTAAEVLALSHQAADLLERRQAAIARLEVAPVRTAAALPPPTGVPISTVPGGPATLAAATEGASARISLQSVLAVAGAVLFAVAAIVFSYFNDDLTEVGTRRAVIGVVTVLFLGGAWLLTRRKLQLSAEAVGALGMVFVALDVASIADAVSDGASAWLFAALGAAVAGGAMIAIGALVRLRSWVWSGSLGLVLVPILAAAATTGRYSAALGFAGAAVVALLLHELVDRVASRFASPMRGDHLSLSVERLLAMAVTLALLVPLVIDDIMGAALPVAGILTVLAVVAGFGARRPAARAWSATAGLLAVAAGALAPLAMRPETAWSGALAVVGAAAVVVALALVPWPRVVALLPLWSGAATSLAAVALPQSFIALGAVVLSLLRTLRRQGIAEADMVLGAAVALGAVVAALVALSIGARRRSLGWRLPTAVAGWTAVLALLAAVSWPAFSRAGQVVVAIAIALVAAAALLVPALARRVPAILRGPAFAASHALVGFALLVSWDESSVTVWAGVAIVAAIAVLGATVPAVLRAGYAVVGYGYALVVLARALDLAGLDAIPVICITSTVASTVALAVTLVHRIPVSYWASILVVTGIPFAMGLVTVLLERTWWTAVATAAIFALSLTLTLTRRPGVGTAVRAIGAALLVPSLSVVVVNVGPQLLESSGSPVTLPIIAAMVAIVLPLSGLIARSLVRGGVGASAITAVRVAIEGSSFLTAAIAVQLALTLPASGLDTALIVFVLLAVGSAATSVVAARRYGWWVAGASLTGALWCVWGLLGVTAVEPFVFPPALGVAAVGVVLVALGRRGAPLVGIGLAIAIATTLTLLLAGGNGADAPLPWRAAGLLAGAAVLTAAGWIVARGSVAVRSLQMPFLALAIAAATGAAVQAVRIGRDLEPVAGDVVWSSLAWGVAGGLVAAAAGAALAATRRAEWRRWLTLPAVAFTVVGPISAVRPGILPMWTLWGLTLAVLVLLIVTTIRSLRGPTLLPPVPAVFAIAWITAVTGWSVRDLHVEWWSLPLGLGLLIAGALVLRAGPGGSAASATAGGTGTVVSWPVGFSGSWWLLAPGIGVTLLPSVLATGTNPATWRAITVIAIALAALLLGSMRRLAAPFVLALVALAAEIAMVFLVQLGRDIDALLWWITLATAGAVLLVIAVGFERRTGGDQGLAARMRDLR